MTPARRPSRRLLLALLAAATATTAAGCAATRPTGIAGADVTGGRTLELYVEGPDLAYARYRLERDGTLRFGGGVDARNGAYTWAGPLTRDEIDRVVDLVRDHRWAEADPPSTYAPPDRVWTITLRGPDVRRAFRVIGDSPLVTPVHEVLDAAARRRHREFLDALPQPGRQE